MKIALVNSYYPPWIGGAETYVSNVSRGLRDLGHEVTVYCSNRPLATGESIEDGIRVVRMNTPLRFYGMPITLLPRRLFSEYDVIHSNFPGPYFAAFSAFIANAKSTPSVLTWHNDLPRVTSGAGFAVRIHDKVSSSYLDLYDRIVATTMLYAKTSKTLKRYSNKLSVIHNGVDTKRFNPNVNGDVVRERLRLGRAKVAIFVGALTTFHAYKGVDTLIRAFKKVCEASSDLKLLIVGAGELASGYKKLAQELGISPRVIFAGGVNDAELPQYYAASDFALLPSRDSSEGFGLVLLEAMATGKPVIGSRVGGIPEIVNHGVNGLLVEPNNVDQLASAMGLLARDDEARSRMGRSALEFAKANDWSAVAAKLCKVYESIQR